MKTTHLVSIFLIALLAVMPSQAQDKPKVSEIIIQTSAQCGLCKERIEKELAFTKGVRYANLDLKNKKVTVRYQTTKTTPDKIRDVISKTGYDADKVAADPVAYEKLPACCKKGGHDNDHSGHNH